MKRYGLNAAISLGVLFFASAASAYAECAVDVPNEWFIQGDTQVIRTVPTQSVVAAPAVVTTGALPANTCAPIAAAACAPVCTRISGPHGIFGMLGQPMVTFSGNNPVVGPTIKLYGSPEQYLKAAAIQAAAYNASLTPIGNVITNSVLYSPF
jgi:hypothetical protein